MQNPARDFLFFMTEPNPIVYNTEIQLLLNLNFLRPEQIKMIDEALAAIGGYGEVHLVVEKGRLRFVRIVHNLDASKYNPGHLTES